MSFIDYTSIIRDFLIDFTSLYFITYVILYRKFRNTEMFVSCTLFNIFILIIVMSIIRTDFNVAVGFGLFAMLSLIQLRSAQFTKTEMAYLFGCVALAVINGAGIDDLTFVLICNLVIILSIWLIGSWSLEHSANLMTVDNVRKMSVTLDHIDESAISNRNLMSENLSEKLGMVVQSFIIKKIDYVRDIVDIVVIYELPGDEKPNFTDNVGPEPDFGRSPDHARSAPGA
ncbi:MAG: DUF4956 domain-containing protein [Hyphomicrobiaceae bacterium]|nr:DUF4956 domain-containing protein [Hyphomicrobiaceae bacterium]